MHKESDLTRHVREYHCDYVTVVDGVMAPAPCRALRYRMDRRTDEGKIKPVDRAR